MKTQYSTDFKFILFILFFIKSLLKSQQLALPNQIITTAGKHQITLKGFIERCRNYIFSTRIKDKIITRYYFLVNIIGEYLLLDNLTLSIMTPIRSFNNRSRLAKEFTRRKFF